MMSSFVALVIISATVVFAAGMKKYFMEEHCKNGYVFMDNMTQIRLKTVGDYQQYPNNMQCTMALVTVSSHYIMIQFKDLKTEGVGDTCPNDWLSMYEVQISTFTKNYIGKTRFCGRKTPTQVYASESRYVVLEFHSDRSVQGEGFDIILTPFSTGVCSEYRCGNSRCIDKSIACGSYSPCTDAPTDCGWSSQGYHYQQKNFVGQVIGAILGLLVLSAVIVVAVVMLCKRVRSPRNQATLHYVNQASPVVIAAPNPAHTYQQPPPPAYQPPGFVGAQNSYTNPFYDAVQPPAIPPPSSPNQPQREPNTKTDVPQ